MDVDTTVHWLSTLARCEEESERALGTISTSEHRREELIEMVQEQQEEFASAQRQQDELARLIRVAERGIKDCEAKVQHLRRQQDLVKDNKTYRVLSTEIEAVLQEMDLKETEALQNIDLLDASRKRGAALAADIQQAQQQVERQRAELQKASMKAEARLRELAREIETCLQQLPSEIASRVTQAKQRMPLPVVRLEDQACGGCHAQFPTQVALEIEQGRAVVRCQACGRYVVAIN